MNKVTELVGVITIIVGMVGGTVHLIDDRERQEEVDALHRLVAQKQKKEQEYLEALLRLGRDQQVTIDVDDSNGLTIQGHLVEGWSNGYYYKRKKDK